MSAIPNGNPRASGALCVFLLLVVLATAVIGIAASGGGGSGGPITGKAADEAYYDTLAELSETGVAAAVGLTEVGGRRDIARTAKQLVAAYEESTETLDGLRLDDPDREEERAALVDRSEPMLEALREAERAAGSSTVDAVLVVVDQRDALLEGFEAGVGRPPASTRQCPGRVRLLVLLRWRIRTTGARACPTSPSPHRDDP